jgi:hypothetical protein
MQSISDIDRERVKVRIALTQMSGNLNPGIQTLLEAERDAAKTVAKARQCMRPLTIARLPKRI